MVSIIAGPTGSRWSSPMHAPPVRRHRTNLASYEADYDLSERAVDQLLANARATTALCVAFLMVLVVL